MIYLLYTQVIGVMFINLANKLSYKSHEIPIFGIFLLLTVGHQLVP